MRFAPSLRPLLAGLALSTVLPASALVIDTGPGLSNGGSASSLFDYRPQQADFQQLAARFTVTEDSRVDSVAVWINWYATGGLNFSIYSSLNATGTPNQALYSTVANIAATDNAADWRGATGLNWSLTPGQYWLVFADVAGDTAQGSIPGGAPAPLGGYAFSSSTSNGWVPYFSNLGDFGVRINSPIPEPSTYWLMVAGCLAVAVSVRRREVHQPG